MTKVFITWPRFGRGDANQIYLATVDLQDDPDYTSAPFVDPADGASRTADSEVLDGPDFPTASAWPAPGFEGA